MPLCNDRSPLMSTIFFAWELGANLGHLTRDLPIARACRDAGHQVVMAVPNLRQGAAVLKGEGFILVQSPVLHSVIPRTVPPIHYADMLMHEGYDDLDFLYGAVTAWEGLLRLIQPAVMVYNHAPTALIAARRLAVPVHIMGTGFEVPPAISPMPGFRPWQAIPETILQQSERSLIAQINALPEQATGAKLTSLKDLFAPSQPQLTTFPELDPFGPRTGVDYIGPLYALSNALNIEWKDKGKRFRIFVYLRPSVMHCERWLSELCRLDAEVICMVPGAPAQWKEHYPALRIYTEALELNDLLKHADLVLSYGAGTIATALLAGVPVLLLPQVTEQLLAGLALERTGAGRVLKHPDAMSEGIQLLFQLLRDPSYRHTAQAFAAKYKNYSQAQSCASVMSALQPYLNPDAGV